MGQWKKNRHNHLQYENQALINLIKYLALNKKLHDTIKTNTYILNNITKFMRVKMNIVEKHRELGGDNGLLGRSTSRQKPTPDGVGRVRLYQRGIIYWHPDTGVQEVLTL